MQKGMSQELVQLRIAGLENVVIQKPPGQTLPGHQEYRDVSYQQQVIYGWRGTQGHVGADRY